MSKLSEWVWRLERKVERYEKYPTDASFAEAHECLMTTHMLAGDHPYLDFKIWMGEEEYNKHMKKIEASLKND